VEAAFRAIDVGIAWNGEGMAEGGFDSRDGKLRVRVRAEFFRPAEKVPLCGNAQKAQKVLRWKAHTGVDEICRIMVERDIERLREGGVS